MISARRFRRERLADAASDELIAATDIADLLVKKGVPFREAHGVVAGARPRGGRRGAGRCPSCRRTSCASVSEHLDQRGRGGADPESWLESKVWVGGTASTVCGSSSTPPRLELERRVIAACTLDRAFYDRPVLDVARDLVGCTVATARPPA